MEELQEKIDDLEMLLARLKIDLDKLKDKNYKKIELPNSNTTNVHVLIGGELIIKLNENESIFCDCDERKPSYFIKNGGRVLAKFKTKEENRLAIKILFEKIKNGNNFIDMEKIEEQVKGKGE